MPTTTRPRMPRPRRPSPAIHSPPPPPPEPPPGPRGRPPPKPGGNMPRMASWARAIISSRSGGRWPLPLLPPPPGAFQGEFGRPGFGRGFFGGESFSGGGSPHGLLFWGLLPFEAGPFAGPPVGPPVFQGIGSGCSCGYAAGFLRREAIGISAMLRHIAQATLILTGIRRFSRQ